AIRRGRFMKPTHPRLPYRLSFLFRLSLLTLLIAVLVAAPGTSRRSRAATNRFVAVGGSDMNNDCSNMAGPCATIPHAISQGASGDVINLGPGNNVEHVIVSQSVTIQGDDTSGSTVDGHNDGRVFRIDSAGVTATLSMLTITHGAADADSGQFGAGIYNN